MIYLHTGLPGTGKTISTLAKVRDRAQKENRAVYYVGIEILKPEMFPGWTKLEDPTKWHELPDGAIIVHDEAQTLYRPRGTGSQVPEHVAKMETHRHKGHDLYLITQHPMLVDSNVRRLAGEHVHAVRPFGAKMATLHKWGQVKEQCDKSRADSLQETFLYPKELFDAYKSATVHTHKFKMPGRIWWLVAIPFLLGACVWVFMMWFDGMSKPKVGAPEELPTTGGMKTGPSGPAQARPVKTKAEWLDERTPRIQGLAHTAPAFDDTTAPTRAPYPAACVAMGKTCRCYTDQATVLDTPEAICRQIVERGYFVEWDTAPKTAREPDRRDDRRERDGRPDAPGRQADISRVALIGSSGSYSGIPPLDPAAK